MVQAGYSQPSVLDGTTSVLPAVNIDPNFMPLGLNPVWMNRNSSQFVSPSVGL